MAGFQALVVILILVHVVHGGKPGMKIRVTQTGLNYAASEAINVLSGDVQGQSIPDQHGENHVTVGKVEWWITGIRITSFGKPTSTVVVNPGAGITWSARGASVSLDADWRYKYRLGLKRRKRHSWAHRVLNKVKKASSIKVSDHGSLDVSVSGVDFSLSVHLGVDNTGRPTISATGCSCSIGDVSVKIHGGASWFYNLFKNNIANAINKNLQGQLCKSAIKAINVNAVRELAKLKLDVDIDKVILDYHLVSPPVFGSGYLETSHKGEFSWKNGNILEKYGEARHLQSGGDDRMVTVWVSDYVMDSLGTVLQSHGVLAYNLSANDLQGDDKDLLNTSCTNAQCIGTFLYQVRELYPNCRMAIELKTTEAPTLNIIPGHLTGYFHGLFKYYVQMANGTEVYLFTTDMKVNATLAAKINAQNKIVAKVDALIPNITVTDSKIKGITDAALNWIFNAISKKFIIPKLNEVGKKGIAIPNVDDVHFVNPELTLSQGAVSIAADLKYQPSQLYFHSK